MTVFLVARYVCNWKVKPAWFHDMPRVRARARARGVVASVSNCSPPRNCPHEALPFVEGPTKAKLAGSIETQPGIHLAALSTFRIVDVLIVAAGNKNV